VAPSYTVARSSTSLTSLHEAARRPAVGLPSPRESAEGEDVVWQELVRAFCWYDRAASRSRTGYLALRLLALAVGSAVTVLAAVRAPAGLTAGLAAVGVVSEGVQQLFQLHPNWINYRSTAEKLRRHAFLFAATVPPYDEVDTRRARLADLLRDAGTTESHVWAGTMRQAGPSAGGRS
jgi:Protein of unknown function (DUF4231)